jgi:ankyrin repeat protein
MQAINEDIESCPDTAEKALFFEYADRDTTEDKMEEFITKSGLLKESWTFSFFDKDGNKVQDDPTDNEALWPLKVVFTKKPTKKRPFKFFHPSRYENLSQEEKLHAAACDDNAELIEQLAAQGVDLNAPRQDGQTALDACTWSGSTLGAETLLDCGADPASTLQAIAGCASWGHAGLLETMLAKGGKVNQEHGNYTSLRWAIEMGHEDCAVVLQKYDAIAFEEKQTQLLKRARQGVMREFLQMVADAHPDLAQDCVIRAGDRCSIM